MLAISDSPLEMSTAVQVILLLIWIYATAASRDGHRARMGVRDGSFGDKASLVLFNQSAELTEADVSQTLAETEIMLSELEVIRTAA